MLPVCFIPCESMESPAAAKTVTPASTRYLRRVTGNLDGQGCQKGANCQQPGKPNSVNQIRPEPGVPNPLRLCLCRLRRGRFLRMLPDQPVSLRAQLQETLRFFVQALAVVAVKHRFSQNAV